MLPSLSTRILLKRIDLYGQVVVFLLVFLLLFTNILSLSSYTNSNGLWRSAKFAVLAHSAWQIVNGLIHFFIYPSHRKLPGRRRYEKYLWFCLILFGIIICSLLLKNKGSDLSMLLLILAIIPGMLSPVISVFYFRLVQKELTALQHPPKEMYP